MSTYAKIIDSAPVFIERVPFISNANEEQLAEYAAAHGYKPLGHSDPRGLYYNLAYEELFDSIREFYIPWELDAAKADAEARVQSELTATLSARVTIPCAGVENGVISDNDALFNAAGDFRGAAAIVDADNVLHPNTAELQEAYKTALADRRNGLYALATYRRALIAAAKDVDAVEAALTATPNPA